MAHIRKVILKTGKVVYDVSVSFRGKRYSERVRDGKQAAERVGARMEAEKKRGTFKPLRRTRNDTVATYGRAWLAERTNRNALVERQMFELHILPERWFSDARLCDVRYSDTDRMIEVLRAKGLSDKRILNVLQPVRSMFKDAIRAELVFFNPISPKEKALDIKRKVTAEIYMPAEIIALTQNRNISAAARTLWSLLFYTGMRLGEACGLRWRDIQAVPGYLAQLHVRGSYEHPTTKTGRDRYVPVHPDLFDILTEWRRDHFDLHTGRRSLDSDFIVPRSGGTCQNTHTAIHLLEQARRSIHIPKHVRAVHSARNTFITLLRRAGGNEKLIEKITHNASGTMVDAYTQWDWEPLCKTVLLLRLEPTQHLQAPGVNSRLLEGSAIATTDTDPLQLPLVTGEITGQFPLGVFPYRAHKQPVLAPAEKSAQPFTQRVAKNHPSYALVPLDGRLLAATYVQMCLGAKALRRGGSRLQLEGAAP